VKFKILQVVEKVERETGIGPATNSLEGCDSTTELLPLIASILAVPRALRVAPARPIRLQYGLHAMTDIPLLNALIFTGLGIAIFLIAFTLAAKLWPIDLWKEIAHERNVAAAILAGAVALGIAWIIAATMH
jgi:putative membrane protein